MAKVEDNLLFRGTSGKIGGQFVLRRLRNGRTIICNMPNFSNRKLSKEQKQHHKRFREASAYAKSASRKLPIYAELAAGTMKNAYNVALGDWFHPPVIHRLERKGNTIRVQATDDVMVAGVQVLVLDEKGKVVEKGEAIKKKVNWWEYATTAEGRVVVEARDLAGNVVKEKLNA